MVGVTCSPMLKVKISNQANESYSEASIGPKFWMFALLSVGYSNRLSKNVALGGLSLETEKVPP